LQMYMMLYIMVDMRKEGQSMKEQLHSMGSKATPRRLRVLSILHAADRPLNVQEIRKRLKGKQIDQATIYRILNALRDGGLVRQIDFLQTHAYFEIADRHDHHHLICIRCQKIENFTGCNFELIVKKVLKNSKQFDEITQHSLELFGICRECKKLGR
ncbi:MAG TPA: transcriptional repressor, partial [Candidatus Paceibacterota bacterium]|nr:transcriptional repressor [Candidatus Paceibacterota bacterium]